MYQDRAKEIEVLKAKLAALKDYDKYLSGLPEDKRLAEILHNLQCRLNHEDQCSYRYEKWETFLPAHSTRRRYLEHAQSILRIIDFATAVKVIQAIFRSNDGPF